VLRTRAVFNATELEPGSRLVQAGRCSELSDTQGGPAWLGRPTSTNLQALEGWPLRSAGTGARLSARVVGQADEHELAGAGGLAVTIGRDGSEVERSGDGLDAHAGPPPWTGANGPVSGGWLVSVLVSFTSVRHCPPPSPRRADEHVADGGKPWWTVSRGTRKRVMGQLIRGFKSPPSPPLTCSAHGHNRLPCESSLKSLLVCW